MVARLVLVTLVACGSKPAPVHPPAPQPSLEPTLAFLPGSGAVAVGTPIYANVAWDSSCTYGAHPCYAMPQTVIARCEANACSGWGEHAAAFFVTPTKPGSLRGTATVRATDGSYRRSFPLAIEAVIPDGAAATCARRDGATLVTLWLTYGSRRVRSAPPKLVANAQPCEPMPYIDHGWPQPPRDAFRYSCPTGEQQLQLGIAAPTFKLATTVGCQT